MVNWNYIVNTLKELDEKNEELKEQGISIVAFAHSNDENQLCGVQVGSLFDLITLTSRTVAELYNCGEFKKGSLDAFFDNLKSTVELMVKDINERKKSKS